MMRRLLQLKSDRRAAVAPTVALSLFALVGIGGVAFDYARMVSMDTELQNAADQAALAAATQLDGEPGACARAAAAAASLLANQTLMANEASSTRAITIANESACDAAGSIRFYQSYNQATDTFGPEATTDAAAKVVFVRVDPRQAFYALTPVVGAMSSGAIAAEATASLGSAMCKVPPVMMCNPAEPDNNVDPSYDFNPNEGQGLRLVIDDPDAPGNFGFLRIDEAGAREVAMQLGYDNPPHGCISSSGGVDTQPGDMQAVRAAFNTRFDISENGAMTCPGGGVCSPSINTRKDLVRSTKCGLTTNVTKEDWHEAPNFPYRARNTSPLSSSNPMIADDPATTADETRTHPEIMGYPRDLCHATSVAGQCNAITGNAIIGNGAWDIDAYFKVNYGWDNWMSQTLLASDPIEAAAVTRYDVYQWEITNSSRVPATQTVGGFNAHNTPVCRAPGITPSVAPPAPDRRRISVAVVNCEAQNVGGQRRNVQVRKWIDVFLVEPAIARPDRTTNGDIYVEVIGVTSTGASSATNLPQRRDVPYLIR